MFKIKIELNIQNHRNKSRHILIFIKFGIAIDKNLYKKLAQLKTGKKCIPSNIEKLAYIIVKPNL